MSRRISLILSFCFFICASCASQPEPVPRTEYDAPAEEVDDAPEQAAEPAAEHVAPSDAPAAAADQGPIDLGLGDGSDDHAPIVIHRPSNDYGDDDIADAADTSRVYDQSCEELADCDGLPELACDDGEMRCLENQCVYTCETDEVEVDEAEGVGEAEDKEADELDEEHDADAFESTEPVDTFDEAP